MECKYCESNLKPNSNITIMYTDMKSGKHYKINPYYCRDCEVGYYEEENLDGLEKVVKQIEISNVGSNELIRFSEGKYEN